jgi:hypothetical protein
MKKLNYLLIAMLMALLTVGIAACGDDEPEGADIVGTWVVDSDMDADLAIFFQFTKDGKFHEVQITYPNGEITPHVLFHGTYTVSGHKLYITYIFENETETAKCDYSVEGDKLTLYAEDGYGSATLTRVNDSAIEPYL